MQKNEKISNSVIRRLPRYYRFLGELLSAGITRISSRELAGKMRVTASQIRQDLNCFGGFGQQGFGYSVPELYEEIGSILGIKAKRRTVLIGAGNLGRAVALHIDYEKCGFELCGIFDSDEKLAGMVLGSLTVSTLSSLEEFCRQNKPEAAILCIPKENAPALCKRLISLGIKAFWNYSHYDIVLDHGDGVIVENVHLHDSLMLLGYHLNNAEDPVGTEKEQ